MRPFLLASLFILALSSVTSSQGAPERPNILFIMSDDHAAHAISAYGSSVNRTPQMDRLATEGLRLDRCLAVNSICTPSRATILTGQYSHRNGVPVFNHLDPATRTVAHRLQEAGYFTAMIGKWHLGSDPQGFDRWNILPGQGRYDDPILYDRDGYRVYRGYVTDVITDLTLDVLENRPKDKPFFVMCHHKAPHREWIPNERYRREFSTRNIPEPATLRDDYQGRTDALREQQQSVFNDLTRRDLKLVPPAGLGPEERQRWLGVKPTEVEVELDGRRVTLTGDALQRWKYQRYLQDYLACVQSVDDSVGRILDWLDAHDLGRNTLVIYTSDQGFFLGDHGLYDKRFMYEPSIRMPFLARWPDGIKPGSVSEALAINCDFAPTFLDLAGVQIPAEIQGQSLVPLFSGGKPDGWRDAIYYRYYHDPGHHNTRAHYGIRTDTHKLIHYGRKDQWELYDLVKDPLEMRNLYNDPAAQSLVSSLKARLTQLQRDLGDTGQFSDSLPPDDVDNAPPQLQHKHADSPTIRHSFLTLGHRTAIVGEEGSVDWEYRGGSRDGWVLPDDRVLIAWADRVEEVTRDHKVIFSYQLDSRNREIGTVQRLPDGATLVTEQGPVPRLLEVDSQGKIVKDIPLQPETDNAHMQTRMARRLANGNYLVPHLLAFALKEYTPEGRIAKVLRTDLDAIGGRPAENWPFTAIRLGNGRTLVSLTHGNRVVELDSEGTIVWQISNPDVGGQFKDPCGVHRLANGNTVIGSHGATEGVSLIEVSPDRAIVWTSAHPAAAGVHEFQILTTNGRPEPYPPSK